MVRKYYWHWNINTSSSYEFINITGYDYQHTKKTINWSETDNSFNRPLINIGTSVVGVEWPKSGYWWVIHLSLAWIKPMVVVNQGNWPTLVVCFNQSLSPLGFSGATKDWAGRVEQRDREKCATKTLLFCTCVVLLYIGYAMYISLTLVCKSLISVQII